jgi:RHH-type proline utilization regulon transcriptional repressor/proline dehydrogenase/delta 1-pyrroline-5-carboxylate dehydrogenase
MADAERYFASYQGAIKAIGKAAAGRGPIDSPGISVKLSALHPRYEFAQRDRVLGELLPRLEALAAEARDQGIGLTVDAEEADRLDLSLDVIEAVSGMPGLKGWDGLGFVVQTYLKRSGAVVDYLADMAEGHGRRLMVRLVKGAYWDSEIKHAQELGFDGYPVFTRKVSTDVSYLAAARKLMAVPRAFYPQFATHNAHSLATVLELAGEGRDFEFQRLHGMGEVLYRQVVGRDKLAVPCRIYAPVGGHEELLAYLVRRLLENGANSSFVNRIQDEKLPIEEIVADPVAKAQALEEVAHPRIPLPAQLFGEARRNSKGLDLTEVSVVVPLGEAMETAAGKNWRGGPIVGGREGGGAARPVLDPADHRRQVGEVVWADAALAGDALTRAAKAAWGWDATPADERATCLERLADLMEARTSDLMALCVREAGKTAGDAIAEVREAVDFCRYYALRARRDFAGPESLPGPTGERNEIALHGRGVFLCISPWNFPLAIFTGQIAAALAAGNAVIAKPAEQTGLIASEAVRLMHEAGIPPEVLHLLPGSGAELGPVLVGDRRIAGVAFTGSTDTAKVINRTLAARDGAIVPLIAETGGQNAMLVDSTALPEQVVRDVLVSSFQSAGQRCSACRVLFVQADVADHALRRHGGASRRRPGMAGDRRRPGHRRGGQIDARGPRQADGERSAPYPPHAAHRGMRSRNLRRPGGFRDRRARAPAARGLRSGPARRPLCRRSPGGGVGRHQRDRLWPDAGHSQPHRCDRRTYPPPPCRGQCLRQPQHHRRGGRCPAVRRAGPLGDRPQGGGAALPAPICDRKDSLRRYNGGRRKRLAHVAG